MKGLIDTNILIYAVSEPAPEYHRAKTFLEKVLSGPEVYGTTWINLGEFLSFTTQPLPGASPLLTIQEALTDVQALLDSPYFCIVTEGDSHWNHLKEILDEAGSARGAFVHDCRIAAIMRENGIDTIFTRDADFRKIPKLKVVNPLS